MSVPATTPVDELHEAIWTLRGYCLLKGGKLGQTWVDEDGKEWAFDKLAAGASVGARYIVWCNASQAVTRGERAPRYKDHRTDDEVIR